MVKKTRRVHSLRARLLLLTLSTMAALLSTAVFVGVGMTREDHCAGVEDEAGCLTQLDARMNGKPLWKHDKTLYCGTALLWLGTGWAWLGGPLRSVRRP